MRRTKSETIAEFRDEFLSGKSEDYKNKFNEKSEDQQYAAIANWKRNAKNFADASKDLAKVTASNVIAYLKDAHKKLTKLETLTPKEAQKIQDVLDAVKGSIDNFDRIKKEQLLKVLISEKERLARQGNDLDRQIENLQNQLG
ncbi:MAG: hypothetical protein J1F12_06075 [Muribaculaceae bacterium]|nr:hypothetical protein [Muribaculaceae bacterium]